MAMETASSVRQFILEQFVYDDSTAQMLDHDTALIDEGIIDSFGIFLIIEFLENEYGIQIADEDVTPKNMGTISNIVQLVERKQTL